MQIAKSGVVTLGALVLAQAFLVEAPAQTVYKTVDEQGNVIYTDRPPANMPVETVEGLDISRSDRAEIASQNDEARKQTTADNTARQIRNEQKAEEANLQAATNEKRAANCTVANKRVTKYSEAQRLYRDKGDGEREYLSDAELDAERSKAVRSVSEWCD